MSYQVVFAALKPDVTDAVIDAAKECGISGATIVPGRGTGLQEAKTFLGLTLETHTDVVFFLTEAELVEPVIAAIETAGRLDEHGTGVVFTLPVERVQSAWSECNAPRTLNWNTCRSPTAWWVRCSGQDWLMPPFVGL